MTDTNLFNSDSGWKPFSFDNTALLNQNLPTNSPLGTLTGGFLGSLNDSFTLNIQIPTDDKATFNGFSSLYEGGIPYYFRVYVYCSNNALDSNNYLNLNITNIINSSGDFIPNSRSVTGAQSTWITYTLDNFRFIDNTSINMLNESFYESQTNNQIYVSDIYLGTCTSSSYCFNRGTKILCLKNNEEIYIPIENLQKGDLVKTYLHGYRKIDSLMHSIFKNNVNEFTKSMYIMPKQDDMIDDLIITGGHSILIDEYESEEVKNQHKQLFGGELDPIDDKYLLLAGKSSKFRQL